MNVDKKNWKVWDPREDIPFRRQLLSKNSQLMRMYIRHGNLKLAKEQFHSVKSNFEFLNGRGEVMNFYTVEDFEQDLKQFGKGVR